MNVNVGLEVAGVIFVCREVFAAAEVNGADLNLTVNGGGNVRKTHHAKLVCTGEEVAVFRIANKLFGDISAFVRLNGDFGVGIVKADVKSCRAVYKVGVKGVGDNELAFAGGKIFLKFCRIKSTQNTAFIGEHHGRCGLIILGVLACAVSCGIINRCDGASASVFVVVLNDIGNGKISAAELNALYFAVSTEVFIVVSAIVHVVAGGCETHYRVEEYHVGIFSVGKSDKVIDYLLFLVREGITALGPIVIGNIRSDAVVGVAKGGARSDETAGEDLVERNYVIFSVVNRLQPLENFFGVALIGNAFVVRVDSVGKELFFGHNKLKSRSLRHIFNAVFVYRSVVEGDVNDLFAVCINRTDHADAYRNGLGVDNIFVACVGVGLITEHYGGEAVFYAHELAVFYLNAVACDNVRNELGCGNDLELVAVGFGFNLVAVVGFANFKPEAAAVH